MASSASTTSKSVAARAALINLDDSTASVFRDCFRQFGIGVSTLKEDAGQRLHREKFDACVVNLDESANETLSAARQSPSNRRIIIFAICPTGAADAVPYSHYGLNVVLEKPLDRQAALRAVRATHLLILNEFRRYVRIPLVVEVEGDSPKGPFTGTSAEFSAGGMSLRFQGISSLDNGDIVNVSFSLPDQPPLTVQTSVCWRRQGEAMVGLRFDASDDSRLLVKKWIEDYLDVG